MRNRSKIPSKWNIWDPPRCKNINYSSIYDKKREFQRSIRKMKLEGPNTCEMSSCCIFDNAKSCSSKIQKKIDAIFFDENENFNCLHLQLVTDEEDVMRKSNSLMVFLKKSRKYEIFELDNSCIYINCKERLKWPAFYNLFEFLLQKPSKTVIGFRFYTHFICKILIDSELTFLLIHSSNHDILKLEAQYKKTESVEYIDYKSAKTSSAENLEAIIPSNTNLTLKRKLQADTTELLNHGKIVHKSCKCKEPKWKHFKPILKCSHCDYKHILEAKGILIKSAFNCPLKYFSSLAYKTSEKVKPCENSTKILKANSVKEVSLKRKLPEEYAEKYLEMTKEKLKSPKLSTESMAEQAEDKSDKKLKNLNQDKENSLKDVKISSMVVLSDMKAPKMSGTIINNNKLASVTDETKTDDAVVKNSFVNFKSASSSVSNILGGKPETGKSFCSPNEIPTFQTANGKSLLISDKARRIAEKIYTEVCSQATESDKEEERKNFSSINSRREFNDDELDSFFKDVCNETDYQCSSPSIKGNSSFQSQQGKSRKSLGGRRSLKPYSHKT